VLDLGCGTGRDVFLLAQIVGETGEVVGVDMTDNQLKPSRWSMSLARRPLRLCQTQHPLSQGLYRGARPARS
jgi:SAM-dependent methyltransferase